MKYALEVKQKQKRHGNRRSVDTPSPKKSGRPAPHQFVLITYFINIKNKTTQTKNETTLNLRGCWIGCEKSSF